MKTFPKYIHRGTWPGNCPRYFWWMNGCVFLLNTLESVHVCAAWTSCLTGSAILRSAQLVRQNPNSHRGLIFRQLVKLVSVPSTIYSCVLGVVINFGCSFVPFPAIGVTTASLQHLFKRALSPTSYLRTFSICSVEFSVYYLFLGITMTFLFLWKGKLCVELPFFSLRGKFSFWFVDCKCMWLAQRSF